MFYFSIASYASETTLFISVGFDFNHYNRGPHITETKGPHWKQEGSH